MRVIVQRVKNASLTSDGVPYSQIGKGFCVFVGICDEDTKATADYMADKVSKLRIFEDQNGKMNLSLKDVNGEVLVVSNFTLYGETKGTNRPSFIKASRPEISKPLYDYFVKKISTLVPTKTGVFGTDMKIQTELDGPINIFIEK